MLKRIVAMSLIVSQFAFAGIFSADKANITINSGFGGSDIYINDKKVGVVGDNQKFKVKDGDTIYQKVKIEGWAEHKMTDTNKNNEIVYSHILNKQKIKVEKDNEDISINFPTTYSLKGDSEYIPADFFYKSNYDGVISKYPIFAKYSYFESNRPDLVPHFGRLTKSKYRFLFLNDNMTKEDLNKDDNFIDTSFLMGKGKDTRIGLLNSFDKQDYKYRNKTYSITFYNFKQINDKCFTFDYRQINLKSPEDIFTNVQYCAIY